MKNGQCSEWEPVLLKSSGPEYLYKYVSADVAFHILESCRLRFSSPKLFNDPFDNDVTMKLPLTKTEFIDAMCVRQGAKIIQGRSAQAESHNQLIEHLNKWFDATIDPASNISPKSVVERVTPKFAEEYELLRRKENLINEKIRELRQEIAICCFSEISDNLLMWSHYADSHQGAVIGLKCIPDNKSFVAHSVVYDSEKLQLMSLTDRVEQIFNGTRYDYEQVHRALTLRKSDVWAYERERRMVETFRTPEQREEQLAYHRFSPTKFDKIIFGCRMSECNKIKLLGLTVRKFPHMSVQVAEKHPTKYALIFQDHPI